MLVKMETQAAGSSVKSGSYEITQATAQSKTFDTGLGSALKHVVVICKPTNPTYSPGFSVSYWDSSSPTNAVFGTADSYGGNRWINGGYPSMDATSPSFGCKITNVSNGQVTVTHGTAYTLGTYYWYAE